MGIIGAATWRSTSPSRTGYSDPTSLAGVGFSLGNGQSWRDESLELIWSYRVPSNTQIVADSLVIIPSTPGIWEIGGPASTPIANYNAGTAFLKVDGTTIHESMLWRRSLWETGSDTNLGSFNGPSSTPFLNGWQNFLSYGDGIQLTSGQVLSVTIDPYDHESGAGFYPQVFRVTVFAVNTATGMHVTIHDILRPKDLSTGQVALSYTVPASGVTVRSVAIWADGGNISILNNSELRCNGMRFAELSQFQGTYRRTTAPIIIPLGFSMFPGMNLELLGCPLLDSGGTISAYIIGTVAGIGYSRARVVNA